MVSVVGNAVRGAGTDRETGMHYTAAPDALMEIISNGNAIESIPDDVFSDDRVTVTDGN